jgi:hypothetical protein
MSSGATVKFQGWVVAEGALLRYDASASSLGVKLAAKSCTLGLGKEVGLHPAEFAYAETTSKPGVLFS